LEQEKIEMQRLQAGILTVILAVLVIIAPLKAQGATLFTYIGPNEGNWSQSAYWTSNHVPNAFTDRARINNAVSAVNVNLDMGITLSGLIVDAGDKLSFNNGASLYLVKEGAINPTVTNNGTIQLNSMGASTSLNAYDAVVTLTGTGTLILGGHPQNSLNPYYSPGSFLNYTTHTIRGGGTINAAVNNKGKIIADNGILSIGGLITNAGELKADNATMVISGGVTNQTGSVMNVTGSEGVLHLASTINGGQINPGDGLVELNNATLLNTNFGAGKVDLYYATLKGNTSLAGTQLTLLEGTSLYINKDSAGRSTITNTGTITLEGTGYYTRMVAQDASVTLTGTGSLILGGPSASLDMYNSTDKFINEVSHTIRGGGTISAALTNKGTVIADNELLTMSGAITNTGSIRAENATLVLNGPLTNVGVAAALSAVGTSANLDLHSSINGGKINPGTGTVNLFSNAVLTTTSFTSGKVVLPAFNTATLKGTNSLTGTALTINDGSTLHIAMDSSGVAKLMNAGSITLNSTSSDYSTILQADDAQATLSGAGSVVLKGPNSYLSGPFLNDTTHTIKGVGAIHGEITNKGKIIADNGTLVIDRTITNVGTAATLSASTASSILELRTTVVGGKINPGVGLVKILGATLSNTIFGSGKVNVNQGYYNYFNGNTVLTGTALTITDHSNMYVRQDDFGLSTITNNGTITLNSIGGGSGLYAVNAAVTLTGTGSLTLGGSGTSLGMSSGTDMFMNDVSHTIQGGGSISATLDNKGSLIANNGILAVSGAVTNTGLMKADNATLSVTGPVINSGGTMTANGSLGILKLQSAISEGQINPGTGTVILTGATLTNSTLGAGKVNVTSYPYYYPYSTFRGNTVLAGTQVTINNGSGLYMSPDDYLVSTITNNGTIKLNSTTADSSLSANGMVATLTGTGSLVLGGKAGNRLDGAGFINDAGHTIRGGGTINAPLTNDGSLIADNKILYVNGGVSGSGNVSVNDGATLYLNAPVQAGNLTMSQLATFRCGNSSAVELQKNFSFAQTDEQRWNWGNGFNLSLAGQGAQQQAIEIGGLDKGVVLSGFSNNFDLAALILSGDGTYGFLTDAINNGNRASSEVLYVDSLRVDPGTTLNLNGLKLYTQKEGLPHLVLPGEDFGGGLIINVVLPTMSLKLGGDLMSPMVVTPLPSSFLFLGSGLLGLLGAGWKFNRRN
jgi:mucin-19